MKEIRIMAEIRAEQSVDNALILAGRPILYDVPTQINDEFGGSYNEIIKAGALTNTDLSDVRLLYNHDLNKIPLARTPKTLKITVDEKGMYFTAELAQTEAAKEVYQAVKRGDLSGMSFAFKVAEGGDNYDAASNTRTIYNIFKVYECSIVPFPAYPETSVEARNRKLASQKSYEERKNSKILINEILKVRI